MKWHEYATMYLFIAVMVAFFLFGLICKIIANLWGDESIFYVEPKEEKKDE